MPDFLVWGYVCLSLYRLVFLGVLWYNHAMTDSQISNTQSEPISQLARENQERAAKERAGAAGLSYVNIAKYPLSTDAMKFSTKAEALEGRFFPFDKNGKTLRVAVVEPATDLLGRLTEKYKAQRFEPDFFVCSQTGFEEAIQTYDKPIFQKKTIEVSQTYDEGQVADLSGFQKLEGQVFTLSAAEFLRQVELGAVAARASDIHFQPTHEGLELRLRIDGVLQPAMTIPEEPSEALITRIKYEAGMRANVSDMPQDGAISFMANGRLIDLRVSTLPTPARESVVMRILDSRRGIKTFSELGFAKFTEEKMLAALHKKNGLVLVTGPTGSGKTTTLYSMLKELNDPKRKLVTLEDPIEYHLPGVSQSQVNEQREYNFRSGFKSLLRHDPDVILVGEIREFATARFVFEAALTGHMVLSSLHTNSSVGAISRLRNMGMEDYNIAPSVNAVFAQQLVRKVCPHCHKQEKIQKFTEADPNVLSTISRLKKIFPEMKVPDTFPVSVGCEKCAQTGYLGLTAICETFFVTDEIREMILHGDSEGQIRNYLLEKTDFVSLAENGLMKVLNGETTLEEIQRVVGK